MNHSIIIRRTLIATAFCAVGCASAADADESSTDEPTAEVESAACRSSQFTGSGVNESAAYSNARSQANRWCGSQNTIGCSSVNNVGCRVQEVGYYVCSVLASNCGGTSGRQPTCQVNSLGRGTIRYRGHCRTVGASCTNTYVTYQSGRERLYSVRGVCR